MQLTLVGGGGAESALPSTGPDAAAIDALLLKELLTGPKPRQGRLRRDAGGRRQLGDPRDFEEEPVEALKIANSLSFPTLGKDSLADCPECETEEFGPFAGTCSLAKPGAWATKYHSFRLPQSRSKPLALKTDVAAGDNKNPRKDFAASGSFDAALIPTVKSMYL